MNGPRLEDWVGREESVEDALEPARAQAMQATLDHGGPPLAAGEALPALWHWLYFWRPAPASALGPDGHPARGGFLPPVELPHRMWAGGQLDFARPLRLGGRARRRSRVAGVEEKRGRSGPLVFVTVEHELGDDEGLCVRERQDLAYRGPRPAGAAQPGEPAPGDAAWQRRMRADPVLLFRYSALTFNGHRIHYDHPYATGQEGYPGLVVHGPLLATLLADLLAREGPGRPLAGFAFRALRPVFDTAPFTLAGRPEGEGAALWVADGEGMTAMRASARFA